MLTIIKLIPLPVFILLSLVLAVALLWYAVKSFRSKNRDAFLPCLVASFAGPIAIYARCIYDYFPVSSVMRSSSMVIMIVFIVLFLFVIGRVIWKRYRKGLIQGNDKIVMIIGLVFLVFGILMSLVIIILMKLGV